MRCMVIGATGAIGQSLITQLSQYDAVSQIVAVVRRDINVAQLFPNAQHHKINVHTLSFDQLSFIDGSGIDQAFMCLGTTKKIAGSKAAFKQVDYGYALAFAQAMKQGLVRGMHVVTAQGANVRSPIFYNQVKGEVERETALLNFEDLYLYRPSLLLDRPHDGRVMEQVSSVMMRLTQSMIPKSIQAISVHQVAKAMCIKAIASHEQNTSKVPSVTVVDNATMHCIH